MQLVFMPDGDTTPITVYPDSIAGGFTELRCYAIAIPPACAEGVLLIDEEPLPVDLLNGRPCWRWQPGFYAGQVQAELRFATGASAARYVLDVSPDPRKLGGEQFAAMVDELQGFRTGFLLGTEPARITIGAGGGFTSPNLEYGRLRAYGQDFVQALREVARRPLRRLQHRRASVQLHQARRVDQQTLRVLARSPLATAVIAGEDRATAASQLFLDVPSVDETWDIAANRTLLYFLKAVISRVRCVRQDLQREARSPAQETRTGLSSRLPERLRYLDELDAGLRRLFRRSPFAELTTAEVSTAGLNAISASPTYGRAHRLAWWILRHGIDGREAHERQWMIPSWEVFERWSFLLLMRQVARAVSASEKDWRLKVTRDGTAQATLALAAGTVELRLQDTFPAWDKGTGKRQALSGERRPDLTLCWREAAGRLRWAVFDAKYQVSRGGILSSMASAHIYHDSLRLEGLPPVYALLLTPAACQARWLMDPKFIESKAVGVLDMTDEGQLQQFLRAFLLSTPS